MDDDLLDTIEQSVALLKKRIVYENVDSVSTPMMLFIACMFLLLAYTAFKVNKALAKSHII